MTIDACVGADSRETSRAGLRAGRLCSLGRVLAALFLFIALLGLPAPEAHALTAPVEQRIGEVVEHLKDGSTYRPPSTAYLRGKERLAANTPGSGALHRELEQLRGKTSLQPRIGKVGQLVLAEAAFRAGWVIGDGLNRKVLHLTVPGAGPAPVGVQRRALTFSQQNPMSNYTPGPAPQPGAGYWFSVNSTTYSFPAAGRADRWFNPPRPCDFAGVAGPGQLLTIYKSGSCGGDGFNNLANENQYWVPEADLYAGQTVEDYDGTQPYNYATPGSQLGPEPTDASVRDIALAELQSDRYPILNQWYDHHLGGASSDPTAPATLISVPNCAGMTYVACQDAIRGAGFTAATRREYADFEGADLSKPAGAVIDTAPAAGAEAEAGAIITVRTNPTGNAMPIAVPAVAPAPGEGAEIYVERLREKGVRDIRIVVPEADDPLFSSGAAVRASPQPGTRIRPDSEVEVTANRTATRPNNRECERSPRQDPDPSGNVDPFDVRTAFLGWNPQTGSRGVTIYLHHGTSTWGYRHIAIGHGWDSADDRADTEKALWDPVPQPEPRSPTSNQFYYFYLRGSVPCTRRVVVEFATAPRDPKPKHVITSFAYPGWFRQKDQPPGFSP